jgi:hypothetical protein
MQPQELETQNHLQTKSQNFQTAENLTSPNFKIFNPPPFEKYLDPPTLTLYDIGPGAELCANRTWFRSAVTIGGVKYVNFRLDRTAAVHNMLREILLEGS